MAAALVFDAAPRMAYRHENKTRLEVARQWGLSLLPELPPESQLAVFDTRLGGGGFAADRGVAKQRISRLETVTNSQPLVRVVQDAVELLAEKSELPRQGNLRLHRSCRGGLARRNGRRARRIAWPRPPGRASA